MCFLLHLCIFWLPTYLPFFFVNLMAQYLMFTYSVNVHELELNLYLILADHLFLFTKAMPGVWPNTDSPLSRISLKFLILPSVSTISFSPPL